jgi:Peptidase family M23
MLALAWCEERAALVVPHVMPMLDSFSAHPLPLLRPWELAQIPVAHRFCAPMGSEHFAGTYNAQKFWDMNEARGGHHSGDDLNGIGGMNTDLGDSVYACADGLVAFVGDLGGGWGKVIILAHRLPDGRGLQSMYAHLEEFRLPSTGSLVARGQEIATVGTAGGHYLAHLHFEIREGEGVDIGGGYGNVPLNRLNPEKTISELSGAAPDDLGPSVLAVALKARN